MRVRVSLSAGPAHVRPWRLSHWRGVLPPLRLVVFSSEVVQRHRLIFWVVVRVDELQVMTMARLKYMTTCHCPKR